MTIQYPPYDDGEDDGGPPPPQQQQPQRTNAEWAELRQERKSKREADARASAAERELAFFKAGLNPESDPRISDFVKAYDGKVDVDSIKQAAIDRGYLQATTPPSDQQVADQQATQRMNGAAAGGAAPPTGLEADKTGLEEAFAAGGREGAAQFLAGRGIPVVRDY